MSGGVDSAVAALLAREEGAEVVGITVKLWADPETDGTKACCSPEAVLGARALAHQLGMPHFTLDLEEDFRRRVVDRFTGGYAEGRTPNPCILCNGEVRLEAMIDLAERVGAERLLTGHYARIVDDADGPLLAGAADQAKDQSYMLAALPPELLGRLGFPLTELTKPEVREIAARHGLAVARKAESQDLCFLAGQGKRGFLAATAACASATARSSTPPAAPSAATADTTTSPSASAAGSASPPRRRSTCSPPTPPPTRSRSVPAPSSRSAASASATRSCTAMAPASTRSSCVTAPAPSPPRSQRQRGAAPCPRGGAGGGVRGRRPGQTAVLLAGDRIVGHGTIAAAA